MPQAIILFGHGSRDPLWRGPIEAVAARISAANPAVPVRCAYLELSEPSLATAVAQLVPAGITSLAVVPMFLGMGRHAREDLPALVAELESTYPGVAFVLRPAVGEDPRLIGLLAEIAAE